MTKLSESLSHPIAQTIEPVQRRWWMLEPARQLLAGPSFRAILALLLVLGIGCVFNGNGAFFHVGTLRDMLRQTSEYGILACGMTFVIICGGIDLSVGSVLGLAAVVFSLACIRWHWPAWMAIPLALAVGFACGIVCGILAAGLRLQPFVATLAMMVFARGLAKTLSGGEKVGTAIRDSAGGYQYVPVPGIFRAIDSRVLGGNLSMVTVILLICFVAGWVMLSWSCWGRELYAIGGNEEAARYSGINVWRAKLWAYAACGLLAALAGICHAAQDQQGDPEAGMTYELTAIAIVVIGGTNLNGGRGGMGLTLLGMLTIGSLEKILSINGVSEASRLMLTGTIIVVAVLAQRRRASA